MEGSTIVSAQMPLELRDKLAQLAAAHDRSLSAELRRATTLYLRVEARDDQEQPA